MEDFSNKLPTYLCEKRCLTINLLQSDRFDESANNLNFYITESRNELRSSLKALMTEVRKTGLPLRLQVNGSVGIGKTFGLAEFVVLERMLNLESKDKFIIYHNFNEKSNDNCLIQIRGEIFCAIYPFIKKDLEKAFESRLNGIPIDLEENSLLHLILELYFYNYRFEFQIDLIKKIFEKLKEVHPDFQIVLVLDQINEIGKGTVGHYSQAFIDFIIDHEQTNLVTVFCASNNNEFNRQNILTQTRGIKM